MSAAHGERKARDAIRCEIAERVSAKGTIKPASERFMCDMNQWWDAMGRSESSPKSVSPGSEEMPERMPQAYVTDGPFTESKEVIGGYSWVVAARAQLGRAAFPRRKRGNGG